MVEPREETPRYAVASDLLCYSGRTSRGWDLLNLSFRYQPTSAVAV